MYEELFETARKELPWGLLPTLKEVETAVARNDWATALERIALLDGQSRAAGELHATIFNRITGRKP